MQFHISLFFLGFGWYCKLGHWLCRRGLSWSLYSSFIRCRMDQWKCKIKLFRITFFISFNAVYIHIWYNTFSILHFDFLEDNNLLNHIHNFQCLLDHHNIHFLPKICNYSLQVQLHWLYHFSWICFKKS